MNKKINKKEEMEYIISRSKRIEKGMKFLNPNNNYEVEEIKDLSWVKNYEKMFCFRSNHIAFVYEGNLYTTLYSDDIYIALRLYEEFKEANFYFPFGENIV